MPEAAFWVALGREEERRENRTLVTKMTPSGKTSRCGVGGMEVGGGWSLEGLFSDHWLPPAFVNRLTVLLCRIKGKFVDTDDIVDTVSERTQHYHSENQLLPLQRWLRATLWNFYLKEVYLKLKDCKGADTQTQKKTKNKQVAPIATICKLYSSIFTDFLWLWVQWTNSRYFCLNPFFKVVSRGSWLHFGWQSPRQTINRRYCLPW